MTGRDFPGDWSAVGQLGEFNLEAKLWISFGEKSLKMGFLHESLGIMLNYVYAPQNKRLVSFSWKLLDRF